MRHLNKWDVEKIIKKENILEFEFLENNKYLTEIETDYFYLNKDFYTVEKNFYETINKELMKDLNINNLDLEIKNFIKKLNKYNEAKDIAQSLMGKIADLRDTTIKEVHKDLEVDFDNDE